jgi:hypothetical protein
VDARATYDDYSRAWNTQDPAEREKLLARSCSDGVVYLDPEVLPGLDGRASLSEYIAASQAEFPGLSVKDEREPDVIADRLRVRWVATQEGTAVYRGVDFVEFGSDGRIDRITNFYDDTPGD